MNFLKNTNRYPSYLQTILTSVLLSAIILITVIQQPLIQIGTPRVISNNTILTNFNFHVHCPLTNRTDRGFIQLIKYLNITTPKIIYAIQAQLSKIDTYAVFQRVFAAPNNEMLMSYCGWARLLNQTNCTNAEFVCTIPGPIFKIPVEKEIQVIWVNQINGSTYDWSFSEDNCYDQTNNSTDCYQLAKQTSKSCTYFSPTDLNYMNKKLVRISPKSVPIDPHIHGLENRPAFDGNSLSWFNNAGDKGIGYFSLSTNDYFKQFNRSMTFWQGMLTNTQMNMIKVNRYLNIQPPGFCFYHDHSMKATLFNNMKGSAGFYILYNQTGESTLPKGNQQIIFIFHFHNQGDSRDYKQLNNNGSNNQIYVAPIGDTLFVSKHDEIYRNMTYRFRFVNGHFDSYYNNISFAVFYEIITDLDGFLVTKQIEPPLYNQNFTKNMHTLNFSVIGSDGVLFSTSIHDLDQFNLAAGERLQLLIKFDMIPKSVSKLYIVCYDGADALRQYVVKLTYNISTKNIANKYSDPRQYYSLDLPFYNLSQLSNSNVSVHRMRPLFSRPTQQIFSINMHPFLLDSGSQNPKIGTIEDWYIINTVKQSHPMHFHIVNFQVLQELSLKVIPQGCSLYELDYFRETNIINFQIQNNSQLCLYLNSLTSEILKPMWPIFNKYLLQNETYKADYGLISGKNVLEKVKNNVQKSKYSITNCSLNNIYKYICSNQSSNIYHWYRRWKDTAQIKPFIVTRIRVRWTKTLYDPAISTYPYFNYGEDQMVQFPGTVYHCHILPHQQNMMMRPIVLQYSDQYISRYNLMQVQNNSCIKQSWFQTFNCINNYLQCPIQSTSQSDSQLFGFRVYCPVTNTSNPSFIQLTSYLNLTNISAEYNVLQGAISSIETYIIFIKSFQTSDQDSNILLSYCGWVRNQSDINCDNAYYSCSIPGPMFYLPTNITFDIIWVNKINGTNLNWTDPDNPSCYNEYMNMSFCRLKAKSVNQQCVYYQESDLNYTIKNINISPKYPFVNTHLHGLQNRPVFDGNPESWFNTAGEKGLGYESLSNPLYFTLFNNSINYSNINLTPAFRSSLKINRYKTSLYPGMFFYHDHTFQVTNFNNKRGLAGYFIIYSPQIEKDYPKGNDQFYIILNGHNQGDVRKLSDSPSYAQTSELQLVPKVQNLYKNINATLYRNQTYRFRILNGHFDSYYQNVSFAYFSKFQNNSIIELQPPFQIDDYTQFSKDMKVLNCTIIGADSTHLSDPIKNISTFTLMTAQRMDILIYFNQVPIQVSNIYVICFDGSDSVLFYVVKLKITLSSLVNNNLYLQPFSYTKTAVPFYDLTSIKDDQIAVKRMRPLFSLPNQKLFTINLRPDYYGGQAQNPKIGTIQDWYLINTIPQAHPIHIHLVNIQAVYKYSLKVVKQGCSLFQLDFLRQTNISVFQKANSSQLCLFILNMTLQELKPFYQIFSNYLPETKLILSDIGYISGKNVMERYNNLTSQSNINNCTLGAIYKYICQNITSTLNPWQKRWKDTISATGLHVTVIRVRWAHTFYNQSLSAYPYFNFGEDELIQYPGFLYHCHILPHEEDMMMRPIILQPSDVYVNLTLNSSKSSCQRSNWTQSRKCINQYLNC